MKKKLLRTIIIAVIVVALVSITALAATLTCPRCGAHTGTYFKIANNSEYHNTICVCGTSYQQEHYDNNGFTACAKCGYK